jgi:hypothetical protein
MYCSYIYVAARLSIMFSPNDCTPWYDWYLQLLCLLNDSLLPFGFLMRPEANRNVNQSWDCKTICSLVASMMAGFGKQRYIPSNYLKILLLGNV